MQDTHKNFPFVGVLNTFITLFLFTPPQYIDLQCITRSFARKKGQKARNKEMESETKRTNCEEKRNKKRDKKNKLREIKKRTYKTQETCLKSETKRTDFNTNALFLFFISRF